MKTKISVVSYKRPKNSTCDLLLNSKYPWSVYVYQFDPYLNEYLENYGEEHIRVITELDKPSLPKKRQLVLTDATDYDFVIMLDDDMQYVKRLDTNEELSIDDVIEYLENAIDNTEYVALSACYNKSDELYEIVDDKNICGNSIFNVEKVLSSNVVYNPNSKCEDMEFTIDLLLKGYRTGRLDYLLIKNQLQGGSTNDGLSYRWNGDNRFIVEGEYMRTKYPQLVGIFEYDEQHFKINTSNLTKYLNEHVR